MTILMNAIYEDGILRPVRPLPLTERQEVQLRIETNEPPVPKKVMTDAEIEQMLDDLACHAPRDLKLLPEDFSREDFYADRL